jgi:hypothetical protein
VLVERVKLFKGSLKLDGCVLGMHHCHECGIVRGYNESLIFPDGPGLLVDVILFSNPKADGHRVGARDAGEEFSNLMFVAVRKDEASLVRWYKRLRRYP